VVRSLLHHRNYMLSSFPNLQNTTGYIHLKGGRSIICPLRSGSLSRLIASHANNICLSRLKIPITMSGISQLGYMEVVRNRGARLSLQILEAWDFLQVFSGLRFGFGSLVRSVCRKNPTLSSMNKLCIYDLLCDLIQWKTTSFLSLTTNFFKRRQSMEVSVFCLLLSTLSPGAHRTTALPSFVTSPNPFSDKHVCRSLTRPS